MRLRRRLTDAETAVIEAATRVVDGDAGRHPYLTGAVNALHLEREKRISGPQFHAHLLKLAPNARAANALRRSGRTVYELLFRMTADDITDIYNAGPHSWAIWYLACEHFGVEPPWAQELRAREQCQFREHLELERSRLQTSTT